MDALLPAVLGAFPQLSGAGLLVFLIILLIRREGAELTRVNTVHDAEMAEKNTEIAGLRLREIGLNEQLDTERALRRAAEDAAGRHRAPEQEGPSPWAG